MEQNYGFRFVLVRELRYLFSHRTALFVSIIGPVIAFVLTYSIFCNGVPNSLPVGAVDMDRTAVSRQIIRMADATASAAITHRYTNMKAAQADLDAGRTDAIIVVPEGTERSLLRGEQAEVALYINGSNVLKAGLLGSALRKSVATSSAGVKLRQHLSAGASYRQATDKVQPVQVQAQILFNPYLSYTYFLAAGVMPMLLALFVLLGTAYSFGRELHHGTGQGFLRIGGGRFTKSFAAKALPYTFIYMAQAMLMNIILFSLAGMPLRGNVALLLLSELLLVVSYQMLALFFLALFANMRLVLSVASAYAMMALSFSGLSFPSQAMPEAAQVFSYLFPFTHWVHAFLGISLRGAPVASILPHMQMLLVFIVIGLLSLPRLRYILCSPQHWGKD